jgi:REP element-mobilizing transposase RayT
MSRRRQRVDVEGGIHHVMNRGVNRQIVFFADDDRIEFGCVLGEVHERFGVETLAYCLMPNHYHLLLRCPDGGISAAMQHLGSAYTRRTNDRIGRDGPLFRGRFHSIHVADDVYLKWVVRYIHHNALDIAGVHACDEYRWSSYRTYLGLRAAPPFLNTGFLLDMFDWNPDRVRAFTEDVYTPRPARLDEFISFAIWNELSLFGDDDDERSQRLDRTIRTLLEDPGGMSDAERAARYRARRKLREDASTRRVHDSLQALLGRVESDGMGQTNFVTARAVTKLV